MGIGIAKFFRIDITDSIDPRINPGRAAQKGTLYRFIPAVGNPVLLVKLDDGLSTNWFSAGGIVVPTGDPNTLAFFDNAGLLSDNVVAKVSFTKNFEWTGVGPAIFFEPGDGESWMGSDDVTDNSAGTRSAGFGSGAVTSPSSTHDSGIVDLKAGDNAGSGAGGSVFAGAGTNTGTGSGGSFNIGAGSAQTAGQAAGDVNVVAGAALVPGVTPGNINLSASGGATPGKVNMTGLSASLPKQAADPAGGSSVAGDIYYNTVSNTIRWFNGAAWASLA